MVLHVDGHALVPGIGRWAPGHGPREQHPVQFQPEVPVQARGIVLLDDEQAASGKRRAPERLRGAGCLPLGAILGKTVAGRDDLPFAASASHHVGSPASYGYRFPGDIMAARAIGTSSISFGLVTIPVKLFATSKSGARVSFNWIDRKTGVRVRQQYFNPDNNEVVPKEDMVKGYQFAKNQFVVFEPDELKVLDQPGTDAIEIAEFVPAEQVERVYFDRAYYLGPDRGRRARLSPAGGRAGADGARCRRALRHPRQAVPGDGAPVQERADARTVALQDEVRSWDEIPVEEGEINPAELDLAVQMIEQKKADEFQPDDYRDEVRERQLELIQQKIDGEQITVAPSAEPQAQIIDLMAALKASIAGEGGEAADAGQPVRKAASG